MRRRKGKHARRFIKSMNRKREDYRIARIAKKVTLSTEEPRYADVSISGTTPIAGTSLITLLSGIAQGDDFNERDGDQIHLNSIQIKGYIQDTATATSSVDTIVRIILVRQLGDCEGAAPAMTDILTADAVENLRNFFLRGEYKVYYDKVHVIRASDDYVTDLVEHVRTIKYYKRFKRPKKLTYKGAASGIATCRRGHFFLITMTNQANTYQPTWDLKARLIFRP